MPPSLNHDQMWTRTEAGLASLRRVKCASAPAHGGQDHSGLRCVDVVTSLFTGRAFGPGIFPSFRCARAFPQHAAPRRRAVALLLPRLSVATYSAERAVCRARLDTYVSRELIQYVCQDLTDQSHAHVSSAFVSRPRYGINRSEEGFARAQEAFVSGAKSV
jgi:hypothetical protein